MRLLSLALALGLVAPSKSEARSRTDGVEPPGTPPPSRQNRRLVKRTGLLEFAPLRSPCGRHVVEVENGAIFLDGKKVHPATGSVHVLAAPSWRNDGDALAWLERRSGETRLVVLPEVAHPTETIVWPLPPALAQDRVHWAGDNRVVVGPEALQPRAVASWSE
jgi:hypothetical protein